jgi:hypothetical protein
MGELVTGAPVTGEAGTDAGTDGGCAALDWAPPAAAADGAPGDPGATVAGAPEGADPAAAGPVAPAGGDDAAPETAGPEADWAAEQPTTASAASAARAADAEAIVTLL